MSTKKVLTISAIVLLFTIFLEICFVHPHVHYWWHSFVGFDMFFGFFGCLALIILAKGAVKHIVQREENYYGGGEDNND